MAYRHEGAQVRACEVTVIIPTRNRRETLAVALRSALGQSDVAVDVIVADQASADGTYEMLMSWRDRRIRVIRNENPLSPAAARNAALELVDTRWVSFLDDDDFWALDRLRELCQAAVRQEADWATSGEVRFVDETLAVSGVKHAPDPNSIWPAILGQNLIPGGGSGVLVRTDLVRGVGGFREDIPRSEDWELWIRLGEAARLAVVDRPLVAYRVSRTSRSHQHGHQRNLALHAWMEQEYGQLRRDCGVVANPLSIRGYEAEAAARAGRRWQAARWHLQAGISAHRPRQIAIGMAALLSPKLITAARDRRSAAHADSEWVEEAEALLRQAYPSGRRVPVTLGSASAGG